MPNDLAKRNMLESRKKLAASGFTASVWTISGVVLAACGTLDDALYGGGGGGGGTGNSISVNASPVQGAQVYFDINGDGAVDADDIRLQDEQYPGGFITNFRGLVVNIPEELYGRRFIALLDGAFDAETGQELEGEYRSLAGENGEHLIASPITDLIVEAIEADPNEATTLESVIEAIFTKNGEMPTPEEVEQIKHALRDPESYLGGDATIEGLAKYLADRKAQEQAGRGEESAVELIAEAQRIVETVDEAMETGDDPIVILNDDAKLNQPGVQVAFEIGQHDYYVGIINTLSLVPGFLQYRIVGHNENYIINNRGVISIAGDADLQPTPENAPTILRIEVGNHISTKIVEVEITVTAAPELSLTGEFAYGTIRENVAGAVDGTPLVDGITFAGVNGAQGEIIWEIRDAFSGGYKDLAEKFDIVASADGISFDLVLKEGQSLDYEALPNGGIVYLEIAAMQDGARSNDMPISVFVQDDPEEILFTGDFRGSVTEDVNVVNYNLVASGRIDIGNRPVGATLQINGVNIDEDGLFFDIKPSGYQWEHGEEDQEILVEDGVVTISTSIFRAPNTHERYSTFEYVIATGAWTHTISTFHTTFGTMTSLDFRSEVFEFSLDDDGTTHSRSLVIHTFGSDENIYVSDADSDREIKIEIGDPANNGNLNLGHVVPTIEGKAHSGSAVLVELTKTGGVYDLFRLDEDGTLFFTGNNADVHRLGGGVFLELKISVPAESSVPLIHNIFVDVVNERNDGDPRYEIWGDSTEAGETLQVVEILSDPDGLIPETTSYFWYRVDASDLNDITRTRIGANQDSYVLTEADVGGRISIQVQVRPFYADGTSPPDFTYNPNYNPNTRPRFTSPDEVTLDENDADATTTVIAEFATLGARNDVTGYDFVVNDLGATSKSHQGFNIDNAGVITIDNPLDYETQSQYVLRVRATDTANRQKHIDLTIHVGNVDEGDAIYRLDGEFTLGETLRAVLVTPDPDGIEPGSLSYAWFRELGGETTTIGDQRSYILTEADMGAEIRLEVSYQDAGETGKAEAIELSRAVSFHLWANVRELDLADGATGYSGAKITAESPAGITKYAFVNDEGADVSNYLGFSIVEETGHIDIDEALDYDVRSEYAMRVRATDADGATGTFDFTIRVNTPAVFELRGNPFVDDTIRIVETRPDPDGFESDVSEFGNDGYFYNWLRLDGDGGTTLLQVGGTEYSLTDEDKTAVAEDGAQIRVEVLYVDGRFENHSLFYYTQALYFDGADHEYTWYVGEDTYEQGVPLAPIPATTPIDYAPVSYAITSDPNNWFTINEETGEISFAEDRVFDYETDTTPNSYDIEITASLPDYAVFGGHSASRIVTIRTRNEDEGDAHFTLNGEIVLGESLEARLETDDPDGIELGSLRYRWWRDTADESVELTPDNIRTGGNFYTVTEDDIGARIRVEVTYLDAGPLGAEEAFTLRTNPVIFDERSAKSLRTINENDVINARVGGVFANSITPIESIAFINEQGDDVDTYRGFRIDSAGSIFVADPNYDEDNAPYDLQVRVTDTEDNVGIHTIRVSGTAVFELEGDPYADDTLRFVEIAADPEGVDDNGYTFSWAYLDGHYFHYRPLGTEGDTHTLTQTEKDDAFHRGLRFYAQVSYHDKEGSYHVENFYTSAVYFTDHESEVYVDEDVAHTTSKVLTTVSFATGTVISKKIAPPVWSITDGDPDGIFAINADGEITFANGITFDHEDPNQAKQWELEVTVTVTTVQISNIAGDKDPASTIVIVNLNNLDEGDAVFELDGDVELGETLAVNMISDDPDGIEPGTLEYTWWRDIVGGDSTEIDPNPLDPSKYTITDADIGARIRVEVSYRDAGFGGVEESETLAANPVLFDEQRSANSLTTIDVNDITTTSMYAVFANSIEPIVKFAFINEQGDDVDTYRGFRIERSGDTGHIYVDDPDWVEADGNIPYDLQVRATDYDGNTAIHTLRVSDSAKFELRGDPYSDDALSLAVVEPDPEGGVDENGYTFTWAYLSGYHFNYQLLDTEGDTHTLTQTEKEQVPDRGLRFQAQVSYHDNEGNYHVKNFYTSAVYFDTGDGIDNEIFVDEDVAHDTSTVLTTASVSTGTETSKPNVYSITGGDPDGIFAINEDGEITFANGITFDYEDPNQVKQWELEVTGTITSPLHTRLGNKDSASKTVIVNLNNLDDGGAEYAVTGVIGDGLTLTADLLEADLDGGVTNIQYTWFTSDGDDSTDDIQVGTGASYTIQNADFALDYYVRITYDDAVTAATADTDDTRETIAYADTVRFDSRVDDYAISVEEGSTGTLATIGAQFNGATTNIAYSLSGTDASVFAIDATSGAITLATGQELDYEDGTREYSFTVRAVHDPDNDASTPNPTREQDVTITVTNRNEKPVWVMDSATPTESYTSSTITKPGVGNDFVTQVRAEDPEGGAITYALKTPSDAFEVVRQIQDLTPSITDDNMFRYLANIQVKSIDELAKLADGAHTLTVVATDEGGATEEQLVTFTIAAQGTPPPLTPQAPPITPDDPTETINIPDSPQDFG